MKQASVIVIGAGVGGLVTAAHLALHGMHVTVLEKNIHAGGRCDRLERAGHRFDTGPTLFVMPGLYQTEFELLGLDLRRDVDLIRVDPMYHLLYEDGTQLALTSNMAEMQTQLESMQAGSFSGLMRYLEEGKKHYRLVTSRLVGRDFRSASDFFSLRNLALLFRLKPLTSHYGHMSSYFSDVRLKKAFTFQDMYVGLSPVEAPATYSMMPYSDLMHGVWYPRGGMYNIVRLLVDRAQEAGVEFVYQAAVDRIYTTGDKVCGVKLEDGSRMASDVIVANADLPYVYRALLPPERRSRSYSRKRFSGSVANFYWALDKPFESIRPHMLLVADHYKESFEAIDRYHSLPSDPNIYLHAPARLDRSMAPAGQDTVTAMIPIGNLVHNENEDWTYIRDVARDHVLRRLCAFGMPDIASHIKFEEAYLPPSWETRYHLTHGSVHGLSHSLTQMGYFRPDNRHARFHNLYFAGASTRPGTGIPTAMISGRLAAQRVLDDRQ